MNNNLLFSWDDLTDNPKTAPKKLLKLFNNAAQVSSSWVEGKIRRENNISFRTIVIVMADSQEVALRVKQTGDIYQVRLNNKIIPIKEQDDIKKAVIEIVEKVKNNADKFQKALLRRKLELPQTIQSTAKRKEVKLAEEEANLDRLIQEAKAELGIA